MSEYQYLDFIVLGIYLFLCLYIGLSQVSKVKTLKLYALGKARLPSPILIISIFATAFGAGSTLAGSEKLFTLGSLFMFCLMFEPVFWLITAKIFANNIERFSGCLSISSVMLKLYGSPGRWVTNFSSIILDIGVIAAQASATGYVFHYFFGVSITTGILISYSVFTIYTALGGISAVVLTEVLQICIFFFIMPLSYAFTLNEIGGMNNLMDQLPLTEWGVEFSWENFPLVASLIFFMLLPNTLPPAIQRYLMAPNSESLKRSLKTLALITIAFDISVCIISYIVRVSAPDINPADTFVYYISNFLPIGIKSIFITGLVAMFMSAAEAHLNCSSVIIVNDIIKVLYPKISRIGQLVALRLSVLLISGVSILFAIKGYGFLSLIWMAQNFWSPIILVPLSAGFLGFKTNSRAFIVSVVTALTFTLYGRYYSGEFATISISLGIIGSSIGLFGMHYCQKYFLESRQLNRPIIQWDYLTLAVRKLMRRRYKALVEVIRTPLHKTHLPKTTYYPFAGFVLVYYFIYTLYLNSDPTDKILLYLLVIGYFLCFTLLLKDILFSERFQRKFLPSYWYLTLTFCLPLVSSYMLFASKGDDFWIVNGLLSAFSLYFFANYIIFATSLTVGAIGGYLLYATSASASHLEVYTHSTLMAIGYIYIFFLFSSLFFMRKKERIQAEQVEVMQMIGASIAHEVKAPIATMSMCANALSEVFNNILIKPSKNKKSHSFTLANEEYEFLLNVTDTIKNLSKKGSTTADNILVSLRTSVVDKDKKLHSLRDCVLEALDEYSAHNESVTNIQVSLPKNFMIYCSSYYFKHLIFNLLKNAYKYNGKDVKIKIWSRGRTLYFKDYGNGIDEDDLPHIFKRFYTKSETGTGIGLPFCRMVMEDLDGTIECVSKVGNFTEFAMFFPIRTSEKSTLQSRGLG